MTDQLYLSDAYATTAHARVTQVLSDGIVLDRTIFYAQGGGQPGDIGVITDAHGKTSRVANTVFSPTRQIIHQVEEPSLFSVGDSVALAIDWPLRLRRMRVHTALHLLSVVLPYPVTGGAVGDGEGRLDFDIQEAGLDKTNLTERLNDLVGRDAAVSQSWITDAELDANPGLVKTMSVKPPRGSGRIRLVSIEGIDLQPCGGTHVRNTGEIGPVVVTDIEKKGKQNRRVRIALG